MTDALAMPEPFAREADFVRGFFCGADRKTAEEMLRLGFVDGDAPSSVEFEDGLCIARGRWEQAG